MFHIVLLGAHDKNNVIVNFAVIKNIGVLLYYQKLISRVAVTKILLPKINLTYILFVNVLLCIVLTSYDLNFESS